MVMRCFSRRGVVSPRNRALCLNQAKMRQVSSSAAAQPEKVHHLPTKGKAVDENHRSPGVNVSMSRHQNEFGSFFSSAAPFRSPGALLGEGSSSGKRDEQDGQVLKQQRDVSPKHPLVKELIKELYSASSMSSPDRVWQIYQDIHEQQQQIDHMRASSTSAFYNEQNALSLLPQHHQLVLRAIAPDVIHARKQNKEQRVKFAKETQKSSTLLSPKLVTYRRGQASNTGDAAREGWIMKTYLQRVSFIFAQLRRSAIQSAASTGTSVQALPSAGDYNHVLGKVAPMGTMSTLSALWFNISGRSVLEEEDEYSPNLRDRRRQGDHPQQLFRNVPLACGTTAGLSPTGSTYRSMMLGISKHLSNSIERAHKAEVTRNIWRGQGKRRKRKEGNSAKAASRGMGNFGQEVPEQARRAVMLASKRAAALMDDMWNKKIQPQAITLDLAARILRLSGNVEGMKKFLRVAYGRDLSNPDAVDSADAHEKEYGIRPGQLNTHTLNTILMTLGEQATVSEMVSAYETLSRPLPIPKSSSGVIKDEQIGTSLFATDFRGLFQNDEQAVSVDEATKTADTSLPDKIPYHRPEAVVPSTTTFSTLIKHTMTAPDPSRMTAPLHILDSDFRLARARAMEHEARQRGEYTLVTAYLMQEALQHVEQETTRVAEQLGMKMPSIGAIDAELELMVSKILRPDVRKEKEKLVEEAVSRGRWTSENFDDIVTKAHISAKDAPAESMLPLSQSDDEVFKLDFVPRFEPPRVEMTYDMVQSFVLHAYKKSSGDKLRFARDVLRRAWAAKLAEEKVLAGAIQHWSLTSEMLRGESEMKTSGSTGVVITRESMAELVAALRKQRRLLRVSLDKLGHAYLDRIEARLYRLSTDRRVRVARRIEKAKAAELESSMKTEREERERVEKSRLATLAREERKEALSKGEEQKDPEEDVEQVNREALQPQAAFRQV